MKWVGRPAMESSNSRRQFDLLAEDPFVDLRPIEAVLMVDPVAGDSSSPGSSGRAFSRRFGEALPCL